MKNNSKIPNCGIKTLAMVSIGFGLWSLVGQMIEMPKYFFTSYYFYREEFIRLSSKLSWNISFFEYLCSLILSGLFIFSGIAVLKLKNWGRYTLIIISVLGIVIFIITPFAWKYFSKMVQYKQAIFISVFVNPFPLLYYMLNIYFFTRRTIVEQFTKE